MTKRPPDSTARLVLLASLATTHLTLLLRAGYPAFAIMALLSWLGGGLLILERETSGPLTITDLPLPRFWSGVLALVWALLVFSFSARLYDPLLHLVPLVVVLGMAALASSGSAASCRQDPLGWQLAVIGLLLPAQVLINRFLPTGFLAAATASVSAALLWMIGVPAYAQGNRIVMLDQVFAVDASCTGVNTISLCLATAVLLVLLLPPPGIVGLRTKAGSLLVLSGLALVFAFLVNVARVALLGLTSANPGPGAFAALRGFAFWHDGGGSHLFSLFSMCLVVGAYVLAQETGLRKRDSRRS